MGEYNQVVGVDHEKCLNCGECLDACPMGCFDNLEFGACGACGMCLEVCPAEAIIVEGEDK